MITKYITIGTTESIEVTLVDEFGVFVNVASSEDRPRLRIRRVSDNYYYDFHTSQFKEVTGPTFDHNCEAAMSRQGLDYEPGKYQYKLYIDPRIGSFDSPDTYLLRVDCPVPSDPESPYPVNIPQEGEIKTQYASFDETMITMEESEIIKADTDITERRVQRGMPHKIMKKISGNFWAETLLWYDFEGGQIIKTSTSIIHRDS